MMDSTPTPAPGLLAKVHAWLRGDRFMVDSRPPTPVGVEPAAAPAITAAHGPSKEG